MSNRSKMRLVGSRFAFSPAAKHYFATGRMPDIAQLERRVFAISSPTTAPADNTAKDVNLGIAYGQISKVWE